MGSRSKVCQILCKGQDCVPNEPEETDSSNYNSDRLIHGGVRQTETFVDRLSGFTPDRAICHAPRKLRDFKLRLHARSRVASAGRQATWLLCILGLCILQHTYVD